MSRVSFGSRVEGCTAVTSDTFDSLEALSEALHRDIAAAKDSAVPECTTLELKLRIDAHIPLVRPTQGPYAANAENDLPADFRNGLYNAPRQEDEPPPTHPTAPCSAIINVADPRERQIVQRAASRGVMMAVEGIDGYRYSFNNAWQAKDEEGARFSYICQDSMQNKDRHANGYNRTTKNLKDPRAGERGPRKPTYDCKGSVSVKFSSSRQSCDVFYRHYAIHDTVAASKAAARAGIRKLPIDWTPPAGYSQLDPQDMGGLTAALKAKETASSALAMSSSPQVSQPAPSGSNISRLLKRKRQDIFTDPPPFQPASGREPSLAELLMQSEGARRPAPRAGEVPGRHVAVAIGYDSPSWERPGSSQQGPAAKADFPLPCQPGSKPAPRKAITSMTPGGPHSAPHPKNFQQFRVGSASDSAGQTPTSQQPLFTKMKLTSQASPDDSLPWPSEARETPQFPPGDTRWVTQRPRVSQACTHCRRLKMKCDNEEPCGGCVKRQVKCIYQSSSQTTQAQAHSQTSTAPPAQMQPTVLQQPQQQTTTSVAPQQHSGLALPPKTTPQPQPTNPPPPRQSSHPGLALPPKVPSTQAPQAPQGQQPQSGWTRWQQPSPNTWAQGGPQQQNSHHEYNNATQGSSHNQPAADASWGKMTMPPSQNRSSSPDPW